ncbi:MAG: D-alanyl-D-alanine carboxypeptidase [Firmicutes bacterium]|nr:D-alanyl-D-alanine carboxypeptidase [Bacillota bacterium]
MKNRFKILLFLLVFSFIFSTAAFADEIETSDTDSTETVYETASLGATELDLSAETAVLMDADTGKILYDKDMNRTMYPASTTKILTALVLLDYFSPEAIIRIGNEIAYVPGDSSKAGHVVNECITVENLLRGLIIPSGNDTATVAAAAVAKRYMNDESLPYESCEQVFSQLMNAKAEGLGTKNTHFVNPHGYHNKDHYTTAYDMAVISREAMKNPLIAEIAAQTAFYGNGAENTLEEESDMISQTYTWNTHNFLISPGSAYYYPNAKGIKTGFTDEAGCCLAAYAENGNVKLIAVLFNDTDPERWLDARKLFNYGFDNYSYLNIQESGEVITEMPLSGQDPFGPETIGAYARQDKSFLLSEEEYGRITKEFELNPAASVIKDDAYYIKAPVAQGDEIGKVKYFLDGETLFEDNLYAKTDIQKATILNNLKYFATNNMKIIAIVIIIIIVILAAVASLRAKARRRRKVKGKGRR